MAEAIADRRVAAERDLREHTSPGGAWVELVVVGLGALMVSLSQSLLVPVLPVLSPRLHTSAGNVEWLLTSTLLVGAVAVPLFGRLGDMFGKRLMLMVALGTLAAGSLLDALTSNVTLLIVGRAVQGASLSAIPLGISLLSSVLPRERVRSAIALVSAMLGVGGALGLPLAGLVGEHADFHVLFWITTVAGAVALAATVWFVRESPIRTGGRVDLIGAVLLSGGLVALLLPLAQGSSWGWTSAWTLGLLGLAVVVLAVFVVVERRVPAALVDIAAMSRRPIVLTNLASLLFGFALFASLIGTASFVEAPRASGYGFGSSIVVGGLCLLPSGLLMLLLAPVAARLIGWWGPHRTLAFGALVVAAGWVLRIVATGSLWEVVIGSTIIGGGTGIGYAAMPTLINRNTPTSEIAAANGLNSLSRSLGSSLASAIGGSLLTASTIVLGGFELPSLGAYRALFAVCGASAALAALAALFIPPGAPDN
ncbi:MFS transporter [Rugosimonospora africana]|uniref:MFS transporter n=1 Tax=Rugosimonospora africana TaxID=556532 RepID=UPI001EF32AAC|nr:MFS transporter [Rugosimonospora africana]